MKLNEVFVVGAREATNKTTGEKFTALDLAMLTPTVSKTNGKEYLGFVKASIATPLSLHVAQLMEGEVLGGRIVKTPLEKPFDYTTKSGRKVKISFETSWVSE